MRKFSIILVFLCLVAYAVSVKPVIAAEQYDVNGAFNEDGTRQGAINCTFFRESQDTTTFELDGTYLANASDVGIVFNFDLGNNESRVYYVYQNETIYVMRPYEPYYTYYFYLVDYVDISWGYLESLVNLNGTDYVCERHNLEVLGQLPFTMTWGRNYKMRLVCNLGEYTYGSMTAEATTDLTLQITREMFPVNRTDIGDLTTGATRMNSSWIQAQYIDSNSTTDWVNFDFHEYGNTTAFLSYNTTSNSVTYNWYGGGSFVDYYVVITISHQSLGTRYWTFACPAPNPDEDNPFSALDYLGDFPFSLSQLPAIFIILIVALSFSWYNAPLGIIATLLVAAILVWMGWSAIGWTWLTLAGSMAFILAIAMQKERER